MAKLAAYHAKRDFGRTSEPKGDEAASSGSSFVIQKHDATRLHYDLRLELDGVMKSWAVTKGPSLLPGDKRLAVHVEDHPIEYNAFEGTIPKGQYGGGTVMIWDRGRWEPVGDPHKGYKKGHLEFRLAGEKLSGAWHLVRMKKRAGERQEPWLLIKSEDEAARTEGDPDILDEKPLSVATGRSLDEIASDADSAVWQSNRGLAADERAARAAATPVNERAAKPPAKRTRTKRAKAEADGAAALPAAALTVGGVKAAIPKELEPCLATLVSEVPTGDRWLHEIKWDGYRLLAFKARSVRLATRRGHDWTARFPAIADAVAGLPVEGAILDGEAVVEDESGVSNFSALQNALSDEHGRIARNAVFVAFDLLYVNGTDLRSLPLEERKARLAKLVPPGGAGALRLSEHIDADGAAMVRSACQLGLEGVISKRRDRPYRSGRGEDWVKIKCTERQEFVVAGYVPSSAAKKAVGSLVLGYHEDGELRHAGRSGTGFTAESARDLFKRLDGMRRSTAPFPAKLNAEERRGVVFVEPELVAEIEFRGWTADGHLRHAAFKGLREDKTASEVVRERPRGGPPAGPQAKRGSPSGGAQPAPPRKSGATGEVAGVRLTHPDRALWEEGITKQGLAEFYDGIADWLLPHIAHRPLSLVRCPNGATRGCFFQKHSWAGLSEHIRRETVRDEGGEEEVLYVEDIRGVVSLVQAGVLEIHPWGAPIADVDRPDRIVMDLDPGDGVAWTDVIAGAREVRERLAAVKLESFVKTTGGKGLHVVVPLAPKADWAEVKAFAKSLADAMASDSPGRFIAKATKAARNGLIYVDYLRNGRGATAIAAYSTRARPGATVAVPLDWEELGPGLKPNHFTVSNLPNRLARSSRDPWDAIWTLRQTLPEPSKGRPSRRAA
jgi:bifunctional non-homologous end joining protein LigD